MNLEARKISFIQQFLRLQNEDIILGLEKLLLKGVADLTDEEIMPMSVNQFNKEIDQSEDDFNKGRIISEDELRAKIKKWN